MFEKFNEAMNILINEKIIKIEGIVQIDEDEILQSLSEETVKQEKYILNEFDKLVDQVNTKIINDIFEKRLTKFMKAS